MGVGLTTNAFHDGGDIPRKFTCEGADESPSLAWQGVPQGAVEVAVVMDDPDASSGTFTHWLIYGISPGSGGLPGNIPKRAILESGVKQGLNSFGRSGYSGPCPPPGKPHRYFFRMYCLDRKIGLAAGAGRSALEAGIKGHVIAEGVLMGRYRRGQ